MREFRCFNLKEAVMVASRDRHDSALKAGIITGRTLEQDARYDVRFRDGTIELNIAAERICPAKIESEKQPATQPHG